MREAPESSASALSVKRGKEAAGAVTDSVQLPGLTYTKPVLVVAAAMG